MKTFDDEIHDIHHGKYFVVVMALGIVMLSALLFTQTAWIGGLVADSGDGVSTSSPAQIRSGGGSTLPLGRRG